MERIIHINNEKQLEDAKEYFKSKSDIIPVINGSKVPNDIKGNIYGLYVDSELKYIGERQQGKISQRLNQHFFGCSEGTSSKYEKIKDAFNQSKNVGYKTLSVDPDYERYSVETYLIQNIDLEWNIRDRSSNTKIVEISLLNENIKIEPIE